MSTPQKAFRVGHSPDPDDAFMFHAMTTGAINTEGREYEHVLLDIETLNKHAMDGTYEISAVSIHSFPEIADNTNTDAFEPIKLFTLKKATDNASAGTHIGFCRARHIESVSDVSGQNASETADLYLFDIKMFTEITTATFSAGNFEVGDKVENQEGASGIIAVVDASNNKLFLHDVVGTFSASGQSVYARGKDNTSRTISAVRSYNISQARSVFQATPSGGDQNFVADIVLDDLMDS